MRRRFLKKLRNFRLMSGIVIALLTILSFQNCAPAPQACANGSKNCTSEGSTNQSSTSSSSSSNNIWGGGSGSNNGQNVAGGGGGSISNGGSSGSGSYSGGGISGGGSGGSSGGSGGSSGGSGSGSNNTTFRFLKDAVSTSVREGETFTLDVSITGGTGPYKFQWFKDGVSLGAMGAYSFYSDSADSYKKEGVYYAEVTDGNQQKIRSFSARVAFIEPTVGCDAGSYFTYTNGQYDVGYNYFTEYFDGPRGKFLIHKSYDTMGFLYQNTKYASLSAYTVTANLPYKGSTYISCRTAIPRIHSPQANPGWGSQDGNYNNDRYADGYNYKYTGQVSFECRNKKLLFKTNTCKWVYTPPPRTTNDR